MDSPGLVASLLRRVGLLGAILVLVALTLSCTVRTIQTGHVGVVTLFGAITGEQLGEGIHLVNPLKRIAELSIRTQESKEHAEVPSSEGLIITLEVSLLHRLDAARAAEVFQKIGPSYGDVLVSPNFRSVMRAVTSAHTANALYSEAREQVAQQMVEQLKRALEPRGIIVENILLRDIKLPDTLKQAIEAKQQAEQDAQRMQFVLQKEKQEAERKRIEAEGIKAFQQTVSEGINENLLRWKGIEATRQLAESQNTKVIIVGAGKDGLPLILDTK